MSSSNHLTSSNSYNPKADRAIFHKAPGKVAGLSITTVSASTHTPSQATLCTPSDGLHRSNRKPSAASAQAAAGRDYRRQRSQTGLIRGLASPTTGARDRAVARLYPECILSEADHVDEQTSLLSDFEATSSMTDYFSQPSKSSMVASERPATPVSDSSSGAFSLTMPFTELLAEARHKRLLPKHCRYYTDTCDCAGSHGSVCKPSRSASAKPSGPADLNKPLPPIPCPYSSRR